MINCDGRRDTIANKGIRFQNQQNCPRERKQLGTNGSIEKRIQLQVIKDKSIKLDQLLKDTHRKKV